MSKRTPAIYRNVPKSLKHKAKQYKQKSSTTKHHVTINNKMENRGKIWEDTPDTNTWYHFMEIEGQKWLVLDGNLIPKRDSILELFSINSRLDHRGEGTK